jgi:hypothetical protein
MLDRDLVCAGPVKRPSSRLAVEWAVSFSAFFSALVLIVVEVFCVFEVFFVKVWFCRSPACHATIPA